MSMEFLFSQIKKMDVVSVNEGKNLGRVCDIAFFYPENKVKGFFVTGSRGFHFTKSDIFIPMPQIVKIGEDVILVNTSEKPPKPPKPPKGEKPCPPNYQPNCPPNNCPPFPPCPPNNCPPPYPSDPRRSFDDYE